MSGRTRRFLVLTISQCELKLIVLFKDSSRQRYMYLDEGIDARTRSGFIYALDSYTLTFTVRKILLKKLNTFLSEFQYYST